MSLYAKELVLPDNEYIKKVTKKNQILLHHTLGSSNPTYVVDGWDVDPARVAAHNVIGGISTKGNKEWDGKIIKALDSKYFAYHLGVKGSTDPTRKPQGYYDEKSIAIETCCYGELTLKNGKYINYLGDVIPESQVIDLGKPFRGYRYFQNYTDAQIEALRIAIPYHAANEGIVLDKGRVFTWDDFVFDIKKFGEKAIAFHVNYRVDGKTDMYPHPKLIAMLNELHK